MTKKEALERLENDFAGTDFLAAAKRGMRLGLASFCWYRSTQSYFIRIDNVAFGSGYYNFYLVFYQDLGRNYYSVEAFSGGEEYFVSIRPYCQSISEINSILQDFDDEMRVLWGLEALAESQQETQLEPQSEPQSEAKGGPRGPDSLHVWAVRVAYGRIRPDAAFCKRRVRARRAYRAGIPARIRFCHLCRAGRSPLDHRGAGEPERTKPGALGVAGAEHG